MMRAIIMLWILALSLVGVQGFGSDGAGSTSANTFHTTGEDPFPTVCVDLSGTWISDNNESYTITQKGCVRLTIIRNFDGVHYSVDVKPNGSENLITSTKWKLVESYHWNSDDSATSLLAERTYSYDDRTIHQSIEIMRLSATLLRQVTEQKTMWNDGRVNDRIGQTFLHRAQK